MSWFKRNQRKIGIILAEGFLLAWIVWISLSVAGMQFGRNPAVQTGRTQAVPPADATALAVDVLKQQDDKLQRDNSGLWPFLNALGGSLGASIGGIGTIFLAFAAFITARNGLKQWQGNREDEQKKREKEQERWHQERAEERRKQDEGRFQAVVAGLGSEREEAKVGAAIMLRTFLQQGYEQFYTQAFDLAVAHLRLPRTPHPSQDPDTSLSLTTLSQALIMVFKETFPLARNLYIERLSIAQNLYIKGLSRSKEAPDLPKNAEELLSGSVSIQSLDATGIQLDNAYLAGANLKQIWMPKASLRKADLSGVDLSAANLSGANLSQAKLDGTRLDQANLSQTTLRKVYLYQTTFREADLSGADLREADLRTSNFENAKLGQADLTEAHLRGANLYGVLLGRVDLSKADLRGARLTKASLYQANLSGSDLSQANLNRARLDGVNLSGADISAANLSRADLSEVDLSNANLSRADLSSTILIGVHLEDALSLEDTNLHGAKGLTPEQLAACKAKGAIIDEDPATSSPSSTVAPPPSAQGSPPSPDTAGSSAVSPQQEPES